MNDKEEQFAFDFKYYNLDYKNSTMYSSSNNLKLQEDNLFTQI